MLLATNHNMRSTRANSRSAPEAENTQQVPQAPGMDNGNDNETAELDRLQVETRAEDIEDPLTALEVIEETVRRIVGSKALSQAVLAINLLC